MNDGLWGLRGLYAALVLLFLVPASSLQAQVREVSGLRADPALGAIESEAERCHECHGADGQGIGPSGGSEGRIAKLAGQSAEYILKQFRDFRDGRRRHDIMNMMARSVDDEIVVHIAVYYESQAPMTGSGEGDSPVGRALFLRGDPARGIMPCADCHGPEGKGVDGQVTAAPRIGGQEWRYLDKQMRDWRSGERTNSPDGVMNIASKLLSDDEIKYLADYLSGLK